MLRHVGLRAGRATSFVFESEKSLEKLARTRRKGHDAFFQSRTFVSSSTIGRRREISTLVDASAPRSTARLPSRPSHLDHPASGVRQLATAALRQRIDQRPISRLVYQQLRHKSSVTDSAKEQKGPSGSTPKAELSPKQTPSQPTPKDESHAASILDRLPHLPALHRPSKEELLAAATGAWSRFKIHFKWFSIRSFRPWNADDISAFFTWILAGHLIWILVGTTTFFSLIIFAINTVFAQETLARWIGNYLTQSTGIQVVFESAVVPKWGDGVITFENVFVSRRPGQGKGQVKKGSPAEAAAATALAEEKPDAPKATTDGDDDGNYTQFDVSMNTVNVTLSFAKWMNGKGLLRDVEIKGVRGVIDRTHVVNSVWAGIDPRTWKHTHQTGDFELDSFKMEDMLVTVHQPDGFRPFSASIHLCELPRLRKQWLFYDFLSANVVSGSYDNAMFAIHPRQDYSYAVAGRHAGNGVEDDQTQWKKHARFRIDGLNIDHLNRGVEGMFAWIKEGKVDIVSDMMFPSDDEGIAKVMSDFYDRLEETVTTSARQIPVAMSDFRSDFRGLPSREGAPEGRPTNAAPAPEEQIPVPQVPEVANSNPEEESEETQEEDKRFMVMDLRIQLNDVRATVPLFTKDVSYINNALIRPIVAYVNSRRAFIPVNCRVVKRMTDFDGSWTMYDSGLMDDMSMQVYEAFARDVLDDDQLRRRRFKKVGVWTLQLAAQALFIGLAGNIA